jgi:hypothetical protein
MGFLSKTKKEPVSEDQDVQPDLAGITRSHSASEEDEQHVTFLAVASGLTASLGGLVFGYCR